MKHLLPLLLLSLLTVTARAGVASVASVTVTQQTDGTRLVFAEITPQDYTTYLFGYDICRSVGEDGEKTTLISKTLSSTLTAQMASITFTDSDALEDGTVYYYWARVRLYSGYSDWVGTAYTHSATENPVDPTPEPEPDALPDGFRLAQATDFAAVYDRSAGTVAISCTLPASGTYTEGGQTLTHTIQTLSAVEVQRCEPAEDSYTDVPWTTIWQAGETEAGTTLTCVDENVKRGTTYRYRVVCRIAEATSTTSYVSVTTAISLPALTNLTAETLGDKGAGPVRVAATVPEVDIYGNPLSAGDISSVTLERQYYDAATTVASFAAPAPGSVVEYVDESVSDGITYTYFFRLYADGRQQDYQGVSIRVGSDVPAAPTGLTITNDEDFRGIELSWEPVTTGRNGGYVDAAAIYYTVTTYNRATSTRETVMQTRKATSVHIDLGALDEITSMTFTVTAENLTGTGGSAVLTEEVGPSYALPYHEDFNRASGYSLMPQHKWSFSYSFMDPYYYTSDGTRHNITGATGDEGLAGATVAAGKEEVQTSTRIEATDIGTLSFWIYTFMPQEISAAEAAPSLTLDVLPHGAGSSDALRSETFSLVSETGGWKFVEIPLADEIAADADATVSAISLRFTLQNPTASALPLCYDEVRITTHTADGIAPATAAPQTAAAHYDISGRRVAPTHRGITISREGKRIR